MFSLEKIQKLLGDPEDFIVHQLVMAVEYGSLESLDIVGGLLESVRRFLEEKRQDDLLELVDFYLENHFCQKPDDKDDEDFEDFISPYIE